MTLKISIYYFRYSHGYGKEVFWSENGSASGHLILLISGLLGQTSNFLNRHNVAGRKVLAI